MIFPFSYFHLFKLILFKTLTVFLQEQNFFISLTTRLTMILKNVFNFYNT